MKMLKWNSKIKIIVTAISILFVGINTQAQYREEIGQLETMYEARARTVLNTVLRPFEYSLVVAVDIDRDEERLEKLQAEIENDFLPGMPGGISSENPAYVNQLHELKNKTEIHLILSNKITKEKEASIRSLLSMKLHLDEKNGDKLTVERSELPNFENEQQADKLPELSWKMWGMIIGFALLALAGLFFYLNRKSRAELDTKNKKDLTEDKNSEGDTNANAAATALPALEAALNEEQNHQNHLNDEQTDADSFEKIAEVKKQILSLITQYPEASSQALTEHVMIGHQKDVLMLCESFGWENSKKLMSGFSPRLWGKLGIALQNQTEKFTESEFLAGLEACHRVILKKYLEIGEFDPKNPFGFFWKLENFDRKKLIETETAQNVAIICFHANQDQVAELMDCLDQSTAEAVTISISKLESFSDAQVKNIVDKMTSRLKTITENPEKEADGIHVAAQLLRSLPAEKEYQFFEKIASENPEEALKIRKTILMFSDISQIPSEIVNEALSLMELPVIVTALRKNHFPATTEHVLKALPPKKSYMIQRDLELSVLTSDKQIGISQREMINSIMAVLKSKNIELLQLFTNLDSKNFSEEVALKVA